MPEMPLKKLESARTGFVVEMGDAADVEVQSEEQELELKELEKAADEAPITSGTRRNRP